MFLFLCFGSFTSGSDKYCRSVSYTWIGLCSFPQSDLKLLSHVLNHRASHNCKIKRAPYVKVLASPVFHRQVQNWWALNLSQSPPHGQEITCVYLCIYESGFMWPMIPNLWNVWDIICCFLLDWLRDLLLTRLETERAFCCHLFHSFVFFNYLGGCINSVIVPMAKRSSSLISRHTEARNWILGATLNADSQIQSLPRRVGALANFGDGRKVEIIKFIGYYKWNLLEKQG